MAEITGTWKPSENEFPVIASDVISASFYVTEAGSYGGMDFKVGDWLIYIYENSSSSWYKSNGGLVTFALGGSANAPDAGFYTKVRLDGNGNIIDAMSLDEKDVPSHKHEADDVSGMDAVIQRVIAAMFQNTANSSAVQFTFDSKTNTITADVAIDEETIIKNEYGQLVSVAGSGSGTPVIVKVKISDVESLTERLAAIEKAIAQNVPITSLNSGVTIEQTAGGKLFSLNLDLSAFTINEAGEVTINQEIIGNLGNGGGSCANHEHTASQITDFNKQVVEVIKDSGLLTLDVKNIPIDETTIIINSKGELSAVAAKNQKHTHVMDDITDLEQGKLVWATLQKLYTNTQGVDFDDGLFEMSTAKLDAVLAMFNKEFKNVTTNIADLQGKVGKIVPAEPPAIDTVSLILDSGKNASVVCTDTVTGENVTVHTGTVYTETTEGFYPENKGKLIVMVDGVAGDSIDLKDGLLAQKYGAIVIDSIEDYYKDMVNFRGFFKAVKAHLELEGLSGGQHTITLRHQIDATFKDSNPLSLYHFALRSPTIAVSNVQIPNVDFHVSGVPVASKNTGVRITAKVIDVYDSRFIPHTFGAISYFDFITGVMVTRELTLDSYADGNIIAKEILITLPDEFTGSQPFTLIAKNAKGEQTATVKSGTLPFRFDFSQVEKYRFAPALGTLQYPPSNLAGFIFSPFNPAIPLTDGVNAKEVQIAHDIIEHTTNDYSNIGGVSYAACTGETYEGKTVRWVTFGLPFDAEYLPNFYFDIIDKNGNVFGKEHNKTLKDIIIFAGLAGENNVVHTWVNCNEPYTGYGSLSLSAPNYAGLDLARSTSSRRWVTFGKGSTVKFSKIFLHIGLGLAKSIDAEALIDSFVESINERI